MPDIAIFLDGVNEVGPTMEGEWPGEIYRQAAAARRHELGNPPRGAGSRPPTGVGPNLVRAANELQFVKRLRRALGAEASLPPGQPSAPPDREPGDICPTIATYYRNLTQMVEGIAEAYDFIPVFFWQPALATTRKKRGSYEVELDTGHVALPGFNETLRYCSTVTDSLMSDRMGLTYFTLHDIFDADTADVFLDHYGHVTADGDAEIARRIADVLEPIVADVVRER